MRSTRKVLSILGGLCFGLMVGVAVWMFLRHEIGVAVYSCTMAGIALGSLLEFLTSGWGLDDV